ncbi:hypothetical protein HRbin01_01359 [archaeon HR01]|nr:hypothetical protein HRbin01_01359 [archaeon HR01]
MKALGIDPGTGSFDLCCIGDDVGLLHLDESVPSSLVAREPEKVLGMILDVGPDVVVGPSGYGLAFKKLDEIDELDLALTTLEKASDGGISVLSGVRRLLRLMREAGLNAYTLPGVIQLPTVPSHRKINRIDLGTADKTCVAAYAVWDQASRMGLGYGDTSLICVEMGYGYNAAVGVEGGRIVDGVGGTVFPGPGYLAPGLMDGELAYLLGDFSKKLLFQGGAAFIDTGSEPSLEEFTRGRWGRYSVGWRCFLEGVVKAVAMLLAVMDERPREIILTGRLSRIPELRADVEEFLRRRTGLPARRPANVFTRKAKDVAMGAALIANGLAGGKYSELVDVMAIKKSEGTVLDHIRVRDFERDRVLKGLRSD